MRWVVGGLADVGVNADLPCSPRYFVSLSISRSYMVVLGASLLQEFSHGKTNSRTNILTRPLSSSPRSLKACLQACYNDYNYNVRYTRDDRCRILYKSCLGTSDTLNCTKSEFFKSYCALDTCLRHHQHSHRASHPLCYGQAQFCTRHQDYNHCGVLHKFSRV